jgi:hypothetical protein
LEVTEKQTALLPFAGSAVVEFQNSVFRPIEVQEPPHYHDFADEFEEEIMPKYGSSSRRRVGSAMRRRKHGTLRSGRAGKGGRVKSRKQAIAIGLAEARRKGAKVPAKR